MKSKIVRVTSCFPSEIDGIWEKLQRLDTLQYIASPYATFKPVSNIGMKWKEGETSAFSLKLFGVIPMGIHTINIIKFNRETLEIYTRESNKNVPVWNHKIILETKANGSCFYTDEVEIHAGWKTYIVFLWSSLFYKHRRRKWLRLLRSK